MKYFDENNLIAFYQVGGKTDDSVSSGRWRQVDEETVTPEYSLPGIIVIGKHPIWDLPGYKGKESKYRNLTKKDKDQIWQNLIKHNQAGVDYLKNIGKVGLTTLGVVGTPVAAITSPLALAGGVAGGLMTDRATKAVSKGKYNNFGEFAGDKLGIDPYFANYLNPGALIGGSTGSKVSTEAVSSTAKSAVSSISLGVKQAKEDVVNGARMVGDILFPQAQPATVGITRNERIQTLPGNYRTLNFHIGKIEYNPDGTIKSSKGIGTPKSVKMEKPAASTTELPKVEQPKAVNIVDRKGNKRDLDIHETYVQRGKDIYTLKKGKDHYTIERGKDIYTPTKEGTKYFYDGVHTSSELIPGQHISTEINPVHTSTDINPVHTSTEINPEAIRNVTVPNDQTIKAGKYFDTKTGKPVTVVRTNTGTGKYNTTTGLYVLPNWFSRTWHNHPILTSLGTLGAVTTTTGIIIPGIIGAVSGKGAKHSIKGATEKVVEVGDKAWNGTEEFEQKQRALDSISNAEKTNKNDSIENAEYNAELRAITDSVRKATQNALDQLGQ